MSRTSGNSVWYCYTEDHQKQHYEAHSGEKFHPNLGMICRQIQA